MIFDINGVGYRLDTGIIGIILFLFCVLCLGLSRKIKNEKIMKMKKYIYVYILIIAIFLIVLGIDMIKNNYKSEEIVELTDKIIASDLKRTQNKNGFLTNSLLIIVISPLLILIIQGINEAIKKKDKKTLKSAIEGLVIVCILSIVTSVGMMSSYKYKTDIWYITTERILETRKYNARRLFRNRYYTRIEGNDEEIEISFASYKQLSEGCVVYVVRDEDGKIRQVYSKEKYTYVGDKLNVSN